MAGRPIGVLDGKKSLVCQLLQAKGEVAADSPGPASCHLSSVAWGMCPTSALICRTRAKCSAKSAYPRRVDTT